MIESKGIEGISSILMSLLEVALEGDRWEG
jgi:hypothetical protein